MKRLTLLLLIAVLAWWTPTFAASKGWKEIDAQEVKQLMDSADPMVVFPLSRIEFNNLRIPGSVNIPLTQLEGALPEDREKTLIFYCLGPK